MSTMNIIKTEPMVRGSSGLILEERVAQVIPDPFPSAEVSTCSRENGLEWRSGQRPYFYPPDEIDVRDGRHEHLLHERVLSVAVRGPVDGVVRYEEGQNVNQNSE